MPVAAAAVTVAVLLQGGASQAQTVSSKPSLKELVAEATQLSNEVDSLGQQYDGLKIQLAHANSEVKIAKQAAARAEAAMAGSQKAVAQLAAMGYMNGGHGSHAADAHQRQPQLVPQPGVHGRAAQR